MKSARLSLLSGLVGPGGTGLGVGPQAELDRHIDRALHADLRDELGEGGVGRLRQRVGDAHRTAVVARVLHTPGVLRAALRAAAAQPLGLEAHRGVEVGADPQAHVHRRGGGEDLEDRPGAVADQRERLRLHGLPGRGVQPVGPVAHHGDHRMRGLAGQHDAHHAGDAVDVRRCQRVDGRLGRVLHVGIQGGLDQVAAPGDLVLADACPGQVLLHVVAEEGPVAGGDTAPRQLVGLRQDAQRLLLGGPQLIGLVGQVLDHGVEHQVAPGQRAVGIGVGVQRAGGLHQPGQQRGLLPVQLRRVDPEVGLRGVLDAEGAVAEGHQVEVAGEDLRLGEGLVQGQRHPDLAQLARRRGLHRRPLLGVGLRDHQQLVVLDVLLFDGRAAAGVEVAGGVAGQARQRAFPVDTVVFGKPLVLDRDDRQLHRVGDLVAGHFEAALRVQPRDGIAFGVHHGGHRGHLALDQLGRTIGHDVGCAVGNQPQTADDGEQQRRHDDAGQQAAPGQLDEGGAGRGAFRHGYRVLTPILARAELADERHDASQEFSGASENRSSRSVGTVVPKKL